MRDGIMFFKKKKKGKVWSGVYYSGLGEQIRA